MSQFMQTQLQRTKKRHIYMTVRYAVLKQCCGLFFLAHLVTIPFVCKVSACTFAYPIFTWHSRIAVQMKKWQTSIVHHCIVGICRTGSFLSVCVSIGFFFKGLFLAISMLINHSNFVWLLLLTFCEHDLFATKYKIPVVQIVLNKLKLMCTIIQCIGVCFVLCT